MNKTKELLAKSYKLADKVLFNLAINHKNKMPWQTDKIMELKEELSKQLRKERNMNETKPLNQIKDKCPECGHNKFWGEAHTFPTYYAKDGQLIFDGNEQRGGRPIECENCGWDVPVWIKITKPSDSPTKEKK